MNSWSVSQGVRVAAAAVLELRRRQRERAEATETMSLNEFVRGAWHVLEPGKFLSNWHIDAICDHLEACARFEVKKLLVNIPPRCSKSLTCAVFFPAWLWTRRPEERMMFSSYSHDLAQRDSVKTRDLIQSNWYQERWGHVFKLKGDVNAKERFETDKTGFRVASTVGGRNTGEGASFVVADDPHKVLEAESEALRSSVVRWWTESMPSRFNDPDRTAWIVIMQRVHQSDLSGELLARELGYEHLCLPARYEPGDSKRATSIGFTDPRTTEGELLWPERLGESLLDDLENTLGEYAFAGQFQQRPAPRSGGMFHPENIVVEEVAPSDITRKVRFWDKAASEGTSSCWTVGVLMGVAKGGRFWVLDVARVRAATDKRDAVIRQTAELDGIGVEQVAEFEGGSGGKDAALAFIRMLAGFKCATVHPTGSKEVRAQPFASQVNGGNVSAVKGAWNAAYFDEIGLFPASKYKDQVDASSGAFGRLNRATPLAADCGSVRKVGGGLYGASF